MTDYCTGSASWRIAFLMLSPPEQRERVRQLAKAGWSPGSISKICGWPISQVMQAIRAASNTTTDNQT